MSILSFFSAFFSAQRPRGERRTPLYDEISVGKRGAPRSGATSTLYFKRLSLEFKAPRRADHTCIGMNLLFHPRGPAASGEHLYMMRSPLGSVEHRYAVRRPNRISHFSSKFTAPRRAANTLIMNRSLLGWAH
ncbi:hypothetical protein M413DRAFT_289956 [Hebeloma cylindrosporum]|uniref:Uncharacterized protein n=1 Tax=Hebeloma cylindrosporum TaxID=76867 RepID=A0A0C2Y5U9_HEBCY|nr:hypothetical protein M413DRAFT_289956 [Hebeloma cylindrosporum h7]